MKLFFVWVFQFLRFFRRPKPQPTTWPVGRQTDMLNLPLGVVWGGDKAPSKQETIAMAIAAKATMDQFPTNPKHDTPFLCFWPGEIVRHMGRPRPNGQGVLAGVVVDAGRSYVLIKWETDLEHPERITKFEECAKLIKQPRPNLAQL